MVKLDRARIQVNRISQFGLMELSRQRLRQSFIEWKCTLSIESCAQKIISLIKQSSLALKTNELKFEINPVLKTILSIIMIKKLILKEKYNVKFIITENLMLENDTIIFNDLKNTKKKKKKIVPIKKRN